MTPTFVSYYTQEYCSEALSLVASLQEFDLPEHIDAIECRGSWEANCAYKPAFIERCLELYPSVVWLDADARVRSDPLPFFAALSGVDVGVHIRAGIELMSGTLFFRRSSASAAELMSGTLFFRRSDATAAVLTRWRECCESNPSAWDQRCLQRVLLSVEGLTVRTLPAVFCHVKDYMPGAPVIEHTQASRRLKAEVNRYA